VSADVAARHPWAVRLVLVTACLALVASSSDANTYTFGMDVPATTTELTTDLTTRVYRVELRTTDFPAGATSYEHAVAVVRGSISSEGMTGGAPSPYVAHAAYDDDGDGQREPRFALTDFETTIPLDFAGACTTITVPCMTSFVVELSRADDGENGGTVTVTWSLLLRAKAASWEENPSHELPWTVTVEEI